jgi:hypothetical protein
VEPAHTYCPEKDLELLLDLISIVLFVVLVLADFFFISITFQEIPHIQGKLMV